VRDVHPPKRRGRFRQRDQLVGFRVESRCVNERGSDPERALLHRLPHQRLHPYELFSRGRAVGIPELVDAHRGGADEGCDVGRHSPLHEMLQVLAERGPGNFELNVALVLDHLLPHPVVDRTH
jgi:hypothetical protein